MKFKFSYYLVILTVLLFSCITPVDDVDDPTKEDPKTEEPKPQEPEEPVTFDPKIPFPQSANTNIYNTVRPNHLSEEEINEKVADYYKYWRNNYLQHGSYVMGSYYVSGGNTGGTDEDKGTSEGHGYGMIITALMGGYDDAAKDYFDGLVKMYNASRSKNNDYLMAWRITAREDGGGKIGSATDGDMDVAYALLLAHEQWGSEGEYNYLDLAKDMIVKGIKAKLVHPSSGRLMLGDWDSNMWTTRPSDWMADHLRAFHHYTNEGIFLTAAETIYNLTWQLVDSHSPETGLLPDFVVGDIPEPAAPNFLEGANDGDYNWNACRIPLRYAVDYHHYGNEDAKRWLEMVSAWVVESSEGEPGKTAMGYFLNGDVITGRETWGYSLSYLAPFVAGTTVSAEHQEWINKGFNIMTSTKKNYYDDTLNMLSLLLVSGNWWSPELAASAK